MSRFSTRVASRRFNSVERDRDYSFVLSEINRKTQISIRFSRVEQVTQKWRNFVARFSSASRHKRSLSSKRKNEIICYNCDKQNHVQSKCLILLNKIDLKYAKKDRNLWALSSFCKFESKKTTLSITSSSMYWKEIMWDCDFAMIETTVDRWKIAERERKRT
jgi:hypothetical protein